MDYILPETFVSLGPGSKGEVPLVLRSGSLDADATRVLDLIGSVEWSTLEHAYGPADDVADLLVAAALGDGATRETAWWNLWGNIHHQRTVYTATEPVVPILQALSESTMFADRRGAIALLTEIGSAAQIGAMPGTHGGVFVPSTEGNDDLGLDRAAADALATRLHASVEQATDSLMSRWESEEQVTRRFLLLLLAVQPRCRDHYEPLVQPAIPDSHLQAWREYAARPDSDEAEARREALEHWAHGSTEAP